MKRIFIFLSVLYFSVLSAPADELKKITILQTADIHSRTGTDSLPGIRQLASALNSERNNSGGPGKCLIVDCGDILQGSFAGSSSRGAVGLSFLNELKYDVWIPGNHDFDFGTDRFLEVMKSSSAHVIAANLYLDGKRPASSWKVIEKNGVRIAVIGMTSPSLDKWHWGKNSYGITSSTFSDPLDEIIPEVMESKCDMIILAIHQGLFQSDRSDFNMNRIAEKYPQIDLVLGAHTHQPAPGETTGVSSWFAQPDAYCASFSLIKAQVDTLKHKTVKIESQLVSVPASGAGNFKFSNKLENLLSNLSDESRREVIFLKNEVSADELNKMTAEAYFMLSPKAVSALIMPQERIIKPGKFTEDDLCWTFPFEDTLCSIDLTDEDLRLIQEEAARLKDGTRFDLVKNDRLSPAGRKTIALSSYLLAGAGGRIRSLANFAKDPACHATDTGVTLRDVFRNCLKKNFPK
ncbi:MAG TPA: hypothetical protein DET40_01310 [Lentisphaeria bacterium]|nr:MAG: hypothetical protein A2X45_09440 [Lentisphaerae bacterium GWF2_50_93]HCE42170.1 hypothetical protein [Lentisphaeria bacterium]